MFKSKSFQEMSSESLATILQSDNLTMDELDIYRAVKEWATVNSVRLCLNTKCLKQYYEMY